MHLSCMCSSSRCQLVLIPTHYHPPFLSVNLRNVLEKASELPSHSLRRRCLRSFKFQCEIPFSCKCGHDSRSSRSSTSVPTDRRRIRRPRVRSQEDMVGAYESAAEQRHVWQMTCSSKRCVPGVYTAPTSGSRICRGHVQASNVTDNVFTRQRYKDFLFKQKSSNTSPSTHMPHSKGEVINCLSLSHFYRETHVYASIVVVENLC